MNYSLGRAVNYVIRAEDGELGRVDQFYFDDLTWIIRYMTIKMERSLPGRVVLIPLAGLGTPDYEKQIIPLKLTIAQVLGSPSIEIGEPISREHEIELQKHYSWPGYWGESYYMPPGYGTPSITATYTESPPETPGEKIRKMDPHLRSTQTVKDFHIQSSDGKIGTIEDYLIDDVTWDIRYLVVNTRIWLPDRFILISPQWISEAKWSDRKIIVDLTRDAIKQSPMYDPEKPVSLDYEGKLRAKLEKQENKEWVLFKFHAPPKSKVYVAGTFNHWNPTALKLHYHGKGVYTAMILLSPGSYEYKFIVNGEWQNGTECTDLVSNTYGTTNSRLVVSRKTTHEAHIHTFPRLAEGESQRMWSAATGG